MYFDYEQYLLTRSIIWIHSHAESPSLANIIVIANSEGFLHSMLATLPGVASMVPRLGMIRLLNWDLVRAPFVQTLSTHRSDFPFGIFCDGFEEWTFPSQIHLCLWYNLNMGPSEPVGRSEVLCVVSSVSPGMLH